MAIETANGVDYTPGQDVEDGLPEEGRVTGSGFRQWDALFGTWADGEVFDEEEWSHADMRKMLKRYGQGRVVENVLTLPLEQLKTKITPAKGDRGEAEWLSNWLEQPANNGGMTTPLEQIVGQMTSAITHKQSYFEKVFKVDEATNKHVYDSVQFRFASTCQLIRNPKTSEFDGYAQEPVTQFQQEELKGQKIKIPPKYAFVYMHNIKRDPISGVSDLEIPYWCWKTQQKLLFLYFNYLENTALGKTIVEASDLGRATQIASQVRSLKGSGVLPIANTSGANQKVYTLDVPATGAGHFMEAIKYLDHVASQSVMAGFVDLTDQQGSGKGSFSLATSATDFFLMGREATAKEMAWTLRNYLWADLFYYNFGRKAAVPKFEFETLTKDDIEKSVQLLTSVITAPQLNVPDGFVEQLALTVAPGLNLDVDKLTAAFQDSQFKAARAAKLKGATQMAENAAKMAAPTSLADRLVRKGKTAGAVDLPKPKNTKVKPAKKTVKAVA